MPRTTVITSLLVAMEVAGPASVSIASEPARPTGRHAWSHLLHFGGAGLGLGHERGVVQRVRGGSVPAAQHARGTEGGTAGLPCGDMVLTQSVNPDSMDPTSVACLQNAPVYFTFENVLARVFTAPEAMTIDCVEFGVALNTGGAWMVDVLILSGDVVAGEADSLAIATVPIPDNTQQQFFIAELPPGLSLAAGTVFSVLLRTPNRDPAAGGDGGEIALGSNGDGETGPTYFQAPSCELPQFVAFADIGFPQMHLVMSIGATAQVVPRSCGTGGSCFEVGSAPGCIQPGCCIQVCNVDPFCCSVQWDQLCVDSAVLLCLDSGQPVEAICTNFNGQSLGGWTLYGLNENGEYFAAPGPSGSPGDHYFRSVDEGNESYFYAPASYLGDWSVLDDGAACGGLEWDTRIFNDGDGYDPGHPDPDPPHVPHKPSVSISNDPDGNIFAGNSATLAAVFTAFDPIDETMGWRHVSAPIGLLKYGNLPQSSEGEWTMTLGTISDWDTLIQNVTELHFSNDWTPEISEVVGYDNICLTNTKCHCLVVNQQSVECANDGTGDFYWSFTFYNYSGVTTEHVLLTPQIGGDIVPNMFSTTLLDGQGAGVIIKLGGFNSGTTTYITVTLLDETIQECCSLTMMIFFPDC